MKRDILLWIYQGCPIRLDDGTEIKLNYENKADSTDSVAPGKVTNDTEGYQMR
jgi:hypothetical protein